MTKDPDQYFLEGCGRCPHFSTPQCKVKSWPSELKALRKIILSTGLKEEAKWGVPCYTHHGKNILILSAFKKYCAISFFLSNSLTLQTFELTVLTEQPTSFDASL